MFGLFVLFSTDDGVIVLLHIFTVFPSSVVLLAPSLGVVGKVGIAVIAVVTGHLAPKAVATRNDRGRGPIK